MKQLLLLDNIQKIKVVVMLVYLIFQVLDLLGIVNVVGEVDKERLLAYAFVWFCFSSIKMYLIVKRKKIGYYLYMCSNIGAILLSTVLLVPNIMFSLLAPIIFTMVLVFVYVILVVYNIYIIKLLKTNGDHFY